MACREGRSGGKFLNNKRRAELLQQVGQDLPAPEEGCRVCRQDNDHANLMLCERCNAEYHIYCLDPPLKAVPEDAWYCASCIKPKKTKRNDGLDMMVLALPPRFTERFGEVVWASGGAGFGWWPSYVYDPRMTVGGARDLARKNLGKKHLVYFFQCLDTPFAVLPDSKIMTFEEGLMENCHLGRVARHAGRNRALQFEEALKVAMLELDKPLDQRMDWNHPEPVSSDHQPTQKPPLSPPRRKPKPVVEEAIDQTKNASELRIPDLAPLKKKERQLSLANRTNWLKALNSFNSSGKLEAA